LKVFRKECEQDSFWRLEFASESSGGIAPLKCSKGGGDRNRLAEVKFRWKNAKSFWPEILEKSERTVRGLREGSVEIVRVIGSCRVARWLEAGETHHPGFEGQYESLISFQPMSLDHFANSGFVSLEGRPNSWFREVPSCEEQGRRSRPLDPSHGRTVGSEPSWGIAYRGFGG
jgi:hypothetical protein